MAWRDRIKSITKTFMGWLPSGGAQSNNEDRALITKTSPTIWEYEMFRLEWDRRTILRELDLLLKQDTRIKRACHVFASTTVRRGITVTVTSNTSDAIAEKAQAVINQVMRDAQINAKLPAWARVLLKAGDLFLNPVVDLSERKIKNIKSLPAITLQRNDDMTGNFPDVNKAFQQIDPITLQPLSEFPLWAVNHIRWDHEEGNRYGNSQYLACRGYWKKLNMTEEDLVVRRRTRAMPRRHHKVGTPDHPGAREDIDNYKAVNQLTPRTTQITTDYFSNGLVEIKDLDPDTKIDAIKDVVHLQEVYMLGTGVPLHLLGFGQNVNRDIVEQQMEQFREDVQELRTLLEYGDSSPYSGLRFIFDFGLALAGIDPTLVDYNIRWFENDNESAGDRVDRVIKLRAAQPDPLISKKTALTVVSKDLGIESEAAIDAELQAIKEEMAEDRQEQQTEANALNPEKPSPVPVDKSTSAGAGKPVTDSSILPQAGIVPGSHKTANDLYFPLHGQEIGTMEKVMAADVRRNYAAVHQALKPELDAYIQKVHALRPVYGDSVEVFEDAAVRKTPPAGATDHLMGLFDAAWLKQEAEMRNDFLQRYLQAAGYGRSSAAKQINFQVNADFVNPNTVHYFQEQAATRVKRIDETTRNLLRKELAEAYQGQETVPQWKARIAKVLDVSSPANRAEMIARSELSWAYNQGLLATYHEVGVTRVQWLAVMDNRTCPVCASRNGETYQINDAPECPAHPNCRCTLVNADNT